MSNIAHAASTSQPDSSCQQNEWQCDNGECINVDFLCDKTNDCADNSDEGKHCQDRDPYDRKL